MSHYDVHFKATVTIPVEAESFQDAKKMVAENAATIDKTLEELGTVAGLANDTAGVLGPPFLVVNTDTGEELFL